MVKVVYIDVLFLSNLLVNYMLLLISAKFSGVYATRFRIFLGAVIGAVFAVFLYFPQMSVLTSILIKTAICFFICFVTFYSSGRIARVAGVFALCSFGFGGGVVALGQIFGAGADVKNSVPYFYIQQKTIIISGIIMAVLMFLASNSKGLDVKRQNVDITIFNDKMQLWLKGYVDSGNLLKDPLTGKDIILISATDAAMLYPEDIAQYIKKINSDNAADIFEKIAAILPGVFYLVPFRTASESHGVMITLKPEAITVNKKPVGSRYLIGISPTAINIGDGSRAIIGIV